MNTEIPLQFRTSLIEVHDRKRGKGTLRARGNHHAGDADDCLRKLWYYWQGYEADQDQGSGMRMTIGKLLEGLAEECLSDPALLGTYSQQHRIEVPVGNRKIAGYIDFLMDFNDYAWKTYFPDKPRGLVPVEVKTLSTSQYEKAVTKGPLPKHVGQLNVYMCAVKAPFGLLFYIQREAEADPPIMTWLQHPDYRQYNQVLRRLVVLNRYLDEFHPPPPRCKENRLDPYCPWHTSRCPADGGWPQTLCKVCGDPVVQIEDHADCIFGDGS